jgi:hypothetical protein
VNREAWQKLLEAGARVWLFRPEAHESDIPAVKKYLKRSVSKGGCESSNYKVKSRDPWYQTPLPSRPHGFISGMSKHGPWIAFNGMRSLNATNTLYVINLHDDVGRDEKFGWALSLLTPGAQKQIRHLGRTYADGLRKHEPSELGKIRLQIPSVGVAYKRIYARAVKLLLSGNRREAQEIAQRAFLTQT